jgi:hypothetical protein
MVTFPGYVHNQSMAKYEVWNYGTWTDINKKMNIFWLSLTIASLLLTIFGIIKLFLTAKELEKYD